MKSYIRASLFTGYVFAALTTGIILLLLIYGYQQGVPGFLDALKELPSLAFTSFLIGNAAHALFVFIRWTYA